MAEPEVLWSTAALVFTGIGGFFIGLIWCTFVYGTYYYKVLNKNCEEYRRQYIELISKIEGGDAN